LQHLILTGLAAKSLGYAMELYWIRLPVVKSAARALERFGILDMGNLSTQDISSILSV